MEKNFIQLLNKNDDLRKQKEHLENVKIELSEKNKNLAEENSNLKQNQQLTNKDLIHSSLRNKFVEVSIENATLKDKNFALNGKIHELEEEKEVNY